MLMCRLPEASEAPGEASCLALNPAAAGRFRDLVAEIDARVSVRAYGPGQLGATRRTGTLYLPGPDLGHWARLRDADNAHAYSLCGVTHTISLSRGHRAHSGLSELARHALGFAGMHVTCRARKR